MSLFDLLWNNKQAAQAIQTAMHGYLSTQNKIALGPKDPIFKEGDSAFAVNSLTKVRFPGKRTMSPFIVGSCQPDFAKVFASLFPAPAGASPVDTKMFENGLIKAMFPAIDAVHKAASITIDPKSVAIVNHKNLGPWATVKTQHSIQIPFSTSTGEITFELPLLKEDYCSERTREVCGYHAEARILMVDDAPTTRALLRQALVGAGFFNLQEAVDGLEAFNKILAASPQFDLIVADWHMPKLAGIDLLKKIRKEPKLANLPVILVTGERNPQEVGNAVREKVSGYVVKPFTPDVIYAAMKKTEKSHESAVA